MKRIITLAAVAALTLTTAFAQGQGRPDGKDEGWKDRVMAEKIAYITAELELTPEEAQAFWPVYNQYGEQNRQLGSTVREAYRDLGQALKDGEDVEAKLDAYTKAVDSQTSHAAEAAQAYKKVLPVEKVAKLFLTEERFRSQQIERLHNGGMQMPPQNGRRPGKEGPDGQAPQRPQHHVEAHAQE